MKIRTLIGLVFLFVILQAGSRARAGVPSTVQIDPEQCEPMPPPSGKIINVSDEAGLCSAVDTAQPGDTILLSDGTYNMAQLGYQIWIDTPNITLRSASGNRDFVILDNNWSASETISVFK